MKIGKRLVERLRFLVQERKHELSDEIIDEIMFIISTVQLEHKKRKRVKSALKWVYRFIVSLIQELL